MSHLILGDNHKLPFLDISIFNKSLRLEFSIYRKTTNNDRYLHFSSNRSPCVKRGVIISLVDRVIRIGSEAHILPELNYLMDTLFCNGYTVRLLESITEKKRHKKAKLHKPQQILSRWWAVRNFSQF